jgi:hypothetical protein
MAKVQLADFLLQIRENPAIPNRLYRKGFHGLIAAQGYIAEVSVEPGAVTSFKKNDTIAFQVSLSAILKDLSPS